MTLYLVSDGDREVWVAYQDDEARMWCYDGHLGRFQFSESLYKDFFWDKENQYTAIDDAQAREAIARGVGKYDLRKLEWLRDEHKSASPDDVLESEQVLAAVEIAPSKEQRANATAEALIHSTPGAWVTWKTYPMAKRSSADVMASNLRHGKVKAIDRLQMNVVVRVRPSGGVLVVEIAKQQQPVVKVLTWPPNGIPAKRATRKAAAKKSAKNPTKKLPQKASKKAAKKVPMPTKAARKMPTTIAAKAVKKTTVSRGGSASGARAGR